MRQDKTKSNFESTFRIQFHESTIKRLEQFTNKRYNNNGEKLVLEILKKIEKNRGTSF